MSKPLSNDVRRCVIEAKLRGETEERIALETQVHKSTVTKLWAYYKKTGSYEVRPNAGGRKPRLSPRQLARISERVSAQPRVTLQQLIADFDLPVCVSALCRTLNEKLGFSYEKKVYWQRKSDEA